MLLFLIDWFHRYFSVHVPSAFSYTSTRMALAALTSLFITIFFGQRFIDKLYELKIGDRVKRDYCQRLEELHKNKNETPTMGGLLILFSLLISLLLWMDLTSSYTLLLFLTILIIGAIGVSDDYLKLCQKNTKGMRAKKKFLFQMGFASFIALYLLFPPMTQWLHMGSFFAPPTAKESQELLTTQQYALHLYIPFFKQAVVLSGTMALLAMALFIVFVITGSSNAVNLTDGLDGLASGCVLFAAASLSLIAFVSNNLDISNYLRILYIEGSGEIAILLAAVVGSCLGFLWYNGYPAQVFMGDTGSLTLGALLGLCSVLLKRELLFGIVGGVFVMEALSVILQVGSYKFRNKKRIFLCSPLHHHFEYKGWSEPKVVLRFWIFALFFGILGIISLKFQ